MEKRLIIDAQKDLVAMALLEDNRLVEFQKEAKIDNKANVGDIIIGKVKKINPGINAAFVDIGMPKMGFLHSGGLGQYYGASSILLSKIMDKKEKGVSAIESLPIDSNKEVPKESLISGFIKEGDRVLVQIAKESISTKGPTLTTKISLSSDFFVLSPFSKSILDTSLLISNKIRLKKEKDRIRSIIQPYLRKGLSLIVRTDAENRTKEEILLDLKKLFERWELILQEIEKTKSVPSLLYKEASRVEVTLRNSSLDSYTEIVVNNEEYYKKIKSLVEKKLRVKEGIVRFYSKDKPIFDFYGITKQRKELLGKTVAYKGGAYLIIEQTEAMHVIDVNSGGRSKRSRKKEDTAIDVNLAAAEEIARQMRLRDLGGIIVVDFIDMESEEHKKELFERMSDFLKNDKTTHKVLPLSKFCLMEITRQRVRQSVSDKVEEVCPTCNGGGKIQPSLFFTEDIEKKIDILVNKNNYKPFSLHVHPYLYSYLNQKHTIFSSSIFSKWKKFYKNRKMKLIEDENLSVLEYKFIDEFNEIISIL